MSKFKVGDKVRAIANCGGSFGVEVGAEFIISKIIEDRCYRDSNINKCDYSKKDELVLIKEENSDITKDLKKALDFLELHDKDRFMMDNIVSTLEDKIDEIRRT